VYASQWLKDCKSVSECFVSLCLTLELSRSSMSSSASVHQPEDLAVNIL
jgi:hypothetical protein